MPKGELYTAMALNGARQALDKAEAARCVLTEVSGMSPADRRYIGIEIELSDRDRAACGIKSGSVREEKRHAATAVTRRDHRTLIRWIEKDPPRCHGGQAKAGLRPTKGSASRGLRDI